MAEKEVIEVAALDPSDEIVALKCVVKPGMGLTDAEKVSLRIHVVKAGSPAFYLKAGQFAKMKRGTADWHVSKSRSYDATNKLMLSIISLEEAVKGANKVQGAAKTRDELVKEAIDKGIIKDSKEAEEVKDETLRELLGL